jgi:hypothetical protein
MDNTKDKATLVFEKLARQLGIDDIEDRIGLYLPDNLEQGVRENISTQINNRFPLRHPFLTGIPTLGIAPRVSRSAAVTQVVNQLLRKNPDLARQVSELRKEKNRLWTEQVERNRRHTEKMQPSEIANTIASVLPSVL